MTVLKSADRSDILIIAATVFALLLSAGLLVFGILHADDIDKQRTEALPGIGTAYAEQFFDDSFVHTVNLMIPEQNWAYMVGHAAEEEYVPCDAEIDGEFIADIALRPKGNSSLSSIALQGSEHFSFKIEFDHYRAGNTFHGLDKLSLSNLGSDPTCMKDFLAYRMMRSAGVEAPLCCYTLLQINGEDFGLYLAVEAIEDSFALRNYGSSFGQLYKPDIFAVETISPSLFLSLPEHKDLFEAMGNGQPGQRIDALGSVINIAFAEKQELAGISALQYAGDDPENYDVIFDTAVFPLTNADRKAYLQAVRTLNSGEHPAEALDLEQVMRYFVVHNFVNNYDSYSGVFVHNFYIHEKDGRLSLVPWDYNLAFGAFSMESALTCFFDGTRYDIRPDFGEALSSDESFVNYPVDTPMFFVSNEQRPVFGAWISDPACKEEYHRLFQVFLESWFDSGFFASDFSRTAEMIRPYIADGLTFYTPEQFSLASGYLKMYCELRAESIRGQLDGSIPATLEGQAEHPETLIDIGDLNLGKTIDFGGLAWGITPDDVEQILDAINDGERFTSAGVSDTVRSLISNPSDILRLAGRALSASPLLQQMAGKALIPALEIIASIIFLLIVLKLLCRPRKNNRRD